MRRVMTAQVAATMSQWFERSHHLEGEALNRAMNALRRDVWENDSEYRRTEAVIHPSLIDPSLFGVSH